MYKITTVCFLFLLLKCETKEAIATVFIAFIHICKQGQRPGRIHESTRYFLKMYPHNMQLLYFTLVLIGSVIPAFLCNWVNCDLCLILPHPLSLLCMCPLTILRTWAVINKALSRTLSTLWKQHDASPSSYISFKCLRFSVFFLLSSWNPGDVKPWERPRS